MRLPKGFSLFEVLVGILIAVLLLLAIYSVFILSQQSERPIINKAEITQNQRAILDRLSRELRQANSIVTSLPTNEIEFEDGHGVLSGDPIQYIHYHLENTDLYREVLYYYFPADPSVHVYHDDLDLNGNPPLTNSIEDRLVGEYLSSLSFSGNGTITISLTFTKGNQNLTITTDVSPRNIN